MGLYVYSDSLEPFDTAHAGLVADEFRAVQTAIEAIETMLGRTLQVAETIPTIPEDASARKGKVCAFDQITGDPIAGSNLGTNVDLPLAIGLGGTGEDNANAARAALGAAASARVLTAGAGLTGGGNLEANRTFDVGAGTGIIVNANSVQIDTDVVARKGNANTFTQALTLESATPTLELFETDAPANEGRWKLNVSGGALHLVHRSDDDTSGANAIVMEVTGLNMVSCNFPFASLQRDGHEVALAEDVPEIPTFYRKAAREVVTLSTTLQDDNSLAGMTLEASTFYRFEAFLPFEGFGGGVKYQFVLAGNTLESQEFTRINSDGTFTVNEDIDTTITKSAAGDLFILIVGYLHTDSGSDITCKLQWAQQSSNVLGTALLKGAYVRLEKMP